MYLMILVKPFNQLLHMKIHVRSPPLIRPPYLSRNIMASREMAFGEGEN